LVSNEKVLRWCRVDVIYILKPDGKVDIKEVRVFGPEKKAPSQRLVAERNIEERVGEVSVEEAGQRFAEAFAQAQAASPEAAEEESEAARRFHEALERTPTATVKAIP
jgi:hypothetical protein